MARVVRTNYPWLDDRIIKNWIPLMKKWGVSEVARSSRGFLTAYLSVGGDPDLLPPEWHAKRNAFIKRHMAQVDQRDEVLYKNGLPTRRHLALVAWAYSPDSDFEDKDAP